MGNIESISPQESSQKSLSDLPDSPETIPGSESFKFSILFNSLLLHDALRLDKSEKIEKFTKILNHKSTIQDWLRELGTKGEEWISKEDLVDKLVQSGIPQESALQFFSQLDDYTSGRLHVARVLDELDNDRIRNDISGSVSRLSTCVMLPSLLDVFLQGDALLESQREQARMLSTYVKNCCVPTSELIHKDLQTFLSLSQSRQQLVKSHFDKFGKTIFDPEKNEDPISNSGGYQRVNKVHSQVQVSSNQYRACQMFDDNNSSYWQSSGSIGTHYIRLTILPQVCIEQMSMTISGSDTSYTPRVVEVVAGQNETSLRRVAMKTLPRRSNQTQTEVLLGHTNTYYRIIQINIKECAQDGCDTKVRGLHLQGYNPGTVESFSEQEATYSWLLCILTATASISITTNPAFRNVILTQSDRYLQHITPLSLSSSSDKRPVFINKNFVEQLHTFFSQLLDPLPPETNQLDMKAYSLLLQFSFAHGYMHLLMPLLHRYVNAVVECSDTDALRLQCVPLLKRLTKVIKDLETQYASPLSLRIEQVRGFAKPREELSGLLTHESINPESSESISYSSKEDCYVMDLILTEQKARPFDLRNLNVLMKTDVKLSPHLCLLFTIPDRYLDPDTHRPTDTEQLFEIYAKYDKWTLADWNKSQEEKQTDFDLPFACLDLTAVEWLEFVGFEKVVSSSYCCMVKLIKSKCEGEAEGEENKKTFSIHAIQLFGDIEPNIELQRISKVLAELHALPPLDSALVDNATLIFSLFTALISLVRNQIIIVNRTAGEGNQTKNMLMSCFVTESHLNLDNLSFSQVWQVFLSLENFGNKFTEHRSLSLEIASQLILACMPFFVTFREKWRNTQTDGSETNKNALEHISAILNEPSVSEGVVSALTGVLETGVLILFPDETMRVEKLLEGAKLASSTDKHPRAQIQTVSALIQHFSRQGVTKLLLGLPRPHEMDLEKEIELDADSILQRVSPLFNILYQRSLQQVESFTAKSDSSLTCINITPLLSSIQSSILNWSYALSLSEKATEHSRNFARILMCRYLNLFERELSPLLMLLSKHMNYERILDAFKDGLLSVLFPELISALHAFAPAQEVRDYVLHGLQGVVHKFTQLSCSIPEFQSTYCDAQQSSETLLGKWERDCAHTSYSNKEDSEVFSCSGAAYMVVEFDGRCMVDNLEFSDKDGKKYKFSGRVGSSNWPYSVNMKGDILNFRYKSDGSELCFKFILSAYGPSGSIHWFRDLYMSLAGLFGLFCGENLKLTKESSSKTSLTEEEVILLKSDIGKSIFRGGLQKSRFMRSFSGMYQTNTLSDTLITQFLNQMIDEEGTAKSTDFLQVCQLTFKQPRYGGYLADKAVRATFAALLWHSQEMREELARFESKKETSKISSLITATYRLAESVRPDLLAAKQVLIQKKEDSPDKSIDADLPLIDCIEKAKFLLRFAGLSRINEADKTSQKRSKFSRKKSKLGVSQVVEKDPYMELILNFVRRDSYSLSRIQLDMEDRAKCAQNRNLAYNFTRDFVLFTAQTPVDSEPYKILSIYLTALFKDYKDTPPHYGGNLEGCGLELESRVRESFYNLTNKLFHWIWDKETFPVLMKTPWNLKFLVSILHYLFNNLWSNYDFSFIHEHRLPRLLFNSAINLLTSTPPQKSDKEQTGISKLEEYLGWISLIQFHSLSLQLSYCIQDTSSEIDEQYVNVAIILYVSCLRELITSIRAGMESVKQKESKRKKEEESNSSDKKDKVVKKDKKKEVSAKETRAEVASKEIEIIDKVIEPAVGNSDASVSKDTSLVSKDDASVSKDTSSVSKDTSLVSKDDASVSKDTSSVSKDTSLVSKDDASVSKDTSSVSKDASLVSKDDSSVSKDASLVSKDDSSVSKDASLVSKDDSSVSKDDSLVSKDDSSVSEDDSSVSKIDSSVEAVKENEIANPNSKITQLKPVTKTDDTLDLSDCNGSFVNSFKMEFSATDSLELIQLQSSVSREKSVTNDFTSFQLKFGEENLTRNLCALGGLAPINPGHARWAVADVSIQMVICHEVLPLLLDVIRSSSLRSYDKIQLLSVSLLVRFVCRVDPQLVDEVMLGLYPSLHLPDSPSRPAGVSFILFLTNLGTVFLQKHKLIQASTIGHYLHELLAEQTWMGGYLYNLQKQLELLPHTADPTCVFHLLVLAGFPDLPAFGMQVEIEQKNSFLLKGLIVQAKEGSNSYEVILANSRSTKNFMEKDVKIKSSILPIKDISSLSHILTLTADCLKINEKTVEQLYVTFLLLKTITNYAQGDNSGETLHKILQSGVLDLFTKLACKPTGIDKKWQISELEHICIRSYQLEKNRSATPSPLADTDKKPELAKEKSVEGPKVNDRDPLANISDSLRANFFTWQGAFSCKLSVIRAAYEETGQNEDTTIENLQRWYTDDKGFRVPEEIQVKAKNWEPVEDDPASEIPEEMDMTLDQGLPKYTPISVDNKDFIIAKDSDKSKKEKEILIPPDKNLESEYSDACKDSLELFYSLENESIKRSEVKKLLSGLSVLQSRQSLFSLILHWNLEIPLCTAFLESMDVSRLFSLLQCAHRCLDEQKFDKMLDQLVIHISETTKKALGVEASKVLGPIKACTISKESPHPNSKTIFESKILVKNAIQYIVTPDPQSCFCAENSVLFGSDSEFTENRREMTGAQFVEEKQVVIQANTLHLKVKTPQLTMDWGWKLHVVVVTAGVTACFDSACKLLERILSNVDNSNLLPLASVWENLYIACCFHPDEERFKIVSLMAQVLKLFTVQNSIKRRVRGVEEVVSKPDPEQRIDLTLLRPLWNYYSKIIDQHSDEKTALRTLKVPPIARMLTDLFTQVELSAVACGFEKELRLSQITESSLDLILQRGIKNVAFVGIAIDSSNVLTEKFIQAQKDYNASNASLLQELPFANLTDLETKKSSHSKSPESSSDSEQTSSTSGNDDSDDSYWSY